MKETNDDACADDRRMEVSLGRGVRSYFDVDDISISVWGSAWSGREVVRIDDRIVGDRRSFRMSTPHRFEHGGHQYEVVLSIASVLRGDKLARRGCCFRPCWPSAWRWDRAPPSCS